MSVRKNADGSTTIGCIEDTIKPRKEPNATSKTTPSKTKKTKNAPKDDAKSI